MIEVMKTFSHVLYRASGSLPKRARLGAGSRTTAPT
jgi:hypothetical protein